MASLASDEKRKEYVRRFRVILGSCNINFLFGAGVNGNAFPCFNQFTNTINTMKNYGLDASGIEAGLAKCNDENIRKKVKECFIDEFNSKNYALNNESLKNLSKLLEMTNKAIDIAENRHPESKRVNVFTLNYDRIVEELLEESGFFYYSLTEKSGAYLPFDVVGYNTATKSFVPTFAVYKMHGSVDANRKLRYDEKDDNDIVFPGPDKLGSVVTHFYEMLFAMKDELLRKNSVLFVIGYSWSDNHVNDIIKSGIDNGLTVVFPKYEKGDEIPSRLGDTPIVLEPANCKKPCDTTKTLAEYFEKAIK